MSSWESITQTALAGTSRLKPTAGVLTEILQAEENLITANTNISEEEKLLQLAAVANNFRQAGVIATNFAGQKMTIAAEENLPYCNDETVVVLKEILGAENKSLLMLWLTNCAAAKQIVPPELITQLLREDAATKGLQPLVSSVIGHRGHWLAAFNPEWKVQPELDVKDAWENGALAQRKWALQQMRRTDAEMARGLLQHTWQTEDANTRLALLETLHEDVSVDDLELLNSFSSDKSKRVKEEIFALQKSIPQSAFVLQMEDILSKTISLQKEKTMLGLGSKTILKVALPDGIDDVLKANGIERLSNEKDITDEAFIIQQLVESVPPSFWENQLASQPEAIVELFRKDKVLRGSLHALANAAVKFKDPAWVNELIKHNDTFQNELLQLIPADEREKFAVKYFDRAPDEIITMMTGTDNTWSEEFTRKAIRHMLTNIYQYNRAFYYNIVHLLPATMADEIRSFKAAHQYDGSWWEETTSRLSYLLQLKTKTLQAFKKSLA